jgi:hypothetical protein
MVEVPLHQPTVERGDRSLQSFDEVEKSVNQLPGGSWIKDVFVPCDTKGRPLAFTWKTIIGNAETRKVWADENESLKDIVPHAQTPIALFLRNEAYENHDGVVSTEPVVSMFASVQGSITFIRSMSITECKNILSLKSDDVMLKGLPSTHEVKEKIVDEVHKQVITRNAGLTRLERQEHEKNDSARLYLQRVRDILAPLRNKNTDPRTLRQQHALRTQLHEAFLELDMLNRLHQLKPGETEDRTKKGIKLTQIKTLPFTTNSKEEVVTVPTLVMQLMQKKQDVIEGQTTVELSKKQYIALAGLMHELELVSTGMPSVLRTEMQRLGVEQTKVDVVSWRVFAGEVYPVTVELTRVSVPRLEEI